MLVVAIAAALSALVASPGPVPSPGPAPSAEPLVLGAPCRVRVASVESRVAARSLETRDPAGVLRSDLERSLDRIDCRRERIDRSYDVIAELVAAESVGVRGRVRANVTVKAIVKDGSGALLAVVHGKARGEDRSSARAALERDLLAAAAAQASESVPEAIRRARGAAR